MSHQTPVARVVPAWQAWLRRWPTATSLADDAPGEAVRMWGRLGYPRRALRLHEAAVVVRDRHHGAVPDTYEALLALPGVGPYTAGAVAAFAHGRRAVVLDVNVRRVLGRFHDGTDALPGAPTRAETDRAGALLPDRAEQSVAWNAAVMELGAVVCTARAPRCEACPLRPGCAWHALATGLGTTGDDAGPGPDGDPVRAGGGTGASAVGVTGPAGRPARRRTTRPQAWHGTDRYVRGLLLAALREAPGAVPGTELELVWPDQEQTARCLAGLVHDGLAQPVGDGYRLPL